MNDRDQQAKILQYLNDKYPAEAKVHQIPGSNTGNFNRCMHYLYEHKLIDGHILEEMRDIDRFLLQRLLLQGLIF